MYSKNNILISDFLGKPKIYSRKFIVNLIFSTVFAILMAISANSFIYLPFTPVPITMQVFTVLLSAIFLGSRWAVVSQVEYILMGIAGFPVFAGFKGGILTIIGPTGGYIIGFVAAAFTTGYIYENSHIITKLFKKSINNIFTCFIACLTGLAIIYFSGYIHLLGYLYIFNKNQELVHLLLKTWELGVKPFIIIDLLKILILLNIEKVYKIKE